MPHSILIVDDEQGIREALSSILADEGYETACVASGEECLALLDQRSFDLVLLDVWLDGIDGLETLERMRKSGIDPMVVMISGHASIETAVRATKLGAFDFIEKPLSLRKSASSSLRTPSKSTVSGRRTVSFAKNWAGAPKCTETPCRCAPCASRSRSRLRPMGAF